VLAFSDPEIIAMACENFVPVAGDDWYQRRRDDAEGRFFRAVSDQSGRGSYEENGGDTRQAIYCLTAGGRLLASKNAGQLPDEMRKTLRDAQERWKSLPEAERRPGAVVVEELRPDPQFDRSPPPGGLVIKTYTRAIERGAGGWRAMPLKLDGACPEPQRDHLWLTETEWRGLVPADPQIGQRVGVPAGVAHRIFRFHLVDSTLGEPVTWEPDEVRSGALTLTVTRATPGRVEFRLDGSALLATAPAGSRAGRSYDVTLLGYLGYDRATRAMDRFDVVALGDYKEGKAGRKALGVAFELARGAAPADRVPPQGARWLPGYLGAKR
jgi:hypothetical protein